MKNILSTMVKNIFFLTVLFCFCCQSTNRGVEVGNPILTSLDIVTLSLHADGEENTHCKLIDVEEIVSEVVFPGQVNLRVRTNSNIALEVIDDAVFDDNAIFENEFSLFREMTEVELNPSSDEGHPVYIEAFVSDVEEPSYFDVQLRGLPNPDVTSDYELHIPAGSVVCAEDAATTSQYTIAFAVAHNEYCDAIYCDETFTWDENYDVIGDAGENCQIYDIRDISGGVDIVDNTFFGLRPTFIFSATETSLSEDTLLSEQVSGINSEKIFILQNDESYTVSSQTTLGSRQDGYNIFGLNLTPEVGLTSGDYTLQILPDTFECLDGSTNQATYEIDFTVTIF